MVVLKVMDGAAAHSDGFVDAIIAFDRKNMREVLEQANLSFPEQWRRDSLNDDSTLIIAFDDADKIVGYVQYGPHWKQPRDVFVTSLQIHPDHRNTRLFARLLTAAAKNLSKRRFRQITSQVQKNNKRAIRLYRKLGFEIVETHVSRTTLDVRADVAILQGWTSLRHETPPLS